MKMSNGNVSWKVSDAKEPWLEGSAEAAGVEAGAPRCHTLHRLPSLSLLDPVLHQ